MTRKTDGEKRKRDQGGRFLPGNPGGPGRPRGEPAKLARATREKWSGRFDQLAENIMDQALKGDLEAARIVMERMWPRPKDAPVCLADMPTSGSIADMTKGIIQAVAQGELTPSEGQALAQIVASHARAVEIADIEQRLEAIAARLDEQEA